MAQADLRTAVGYYGREAGSAVAMRFTEAVEALFRRLAAGSAIGSLRYARELDLPQLRSVAVRRFPYLVFYMHDDSQVDVVRVLHAKRDLPSLISGSFGG